LKEGGEKGGWEFNYPPKMIFKQKKEKKRNVEIVGKKMTANVPNGG